MKKYLSFLAVAATAAFSLNSCNDNDQSWVMPVVSSNGVFVVNNGNEPGGLDGTLTYYDYETGIATTGVYQAANEGASLGMTVNHAVVYGSKIYIVGNGEQTVFVADRKTLKKVANVKVEVNDAAAQPRQAVAGYGYVFVSTFSNAVIAIDTLTYKIAATYKSGDYSESMAFNNYSPILYVANSNYGYGVQENSFPSISAINIFTGDTLMFTDSKLQNPVDIKLVNDRLFVLDSGYYDEDWEQKDAGVYEIKNNQVTFCTAATEMAVGGSKLFLINAPFSQTPDKPTYTVFDTETNMTRTFCDGEDIQYPSKISTDPVRGYVYITSYYSDNGYASWKEPCYCVIYSGGGTKQGQFDCGMGAGYAVPNINVDYVQM